MYIYIGRRQAFKSAADQRFLPRRDTPIESDEEALDAHATFQAAIYFFSLSAYHFAYLFAYLFPYLFIYQNFHLSIYLSIFYPSIQL